MKPRLGRIAAALTVVVAVGVGASAPAMAKSQSPAKDAAKAKVVMKAALKPPTAPPGATPLPKPAPTGKTVVNLTCNNPSCSTTAKGQEAAAKALGWTFKSIPFNLADSSTFISAMDSALALKPAFVTFSGVPEAVWASFIPKYKAAGVGIVPVVSGTFKPDATILGYEQDKTYAAAAAQMLGSWFIQDSGGKGHAMMMNFPDVGVSVALTAAFEDYVKSNCGECTVDTADVSLQKLVSGAAPAVMASAVQANPSVTHVFAADGSASFGLRAALDAIGRKDAKIAGLNGGYQNFAGIEAGTESAWINGSSTAGGYTAIDIGLHGMAGKKAQYKTDHYPPIFLVTKDNIASLGGASAAKASGLFEVPADLLQQYVALWKVKSPK